MKEKFVLTLALLATIFSVSFGAVALAVTDNASDNNYGLDAALKRSQLPTEVAGESTISGVAGKLVQYGLSLIGIIFFLLMLYAGYLWMSAMGNTEKVDKAKLILETAIIGLVLVMGAYAITTFIFESLSGNSASSQSSSGADQVDKCAAEFPDKNAFCVDFETPNNCDAPRVYTPKLCPGPPNIMCCHDP